MNGSNKNTADKTEVDPKGTSYYYNLGKNISIKLEKIKDFLQKGFQNLVVDSNKVYDAIFSEKVKILVEKFQPGDEFREALTDIDHPRSPEMKENMLSKMLKYNLYKNQLIKVQNSERPLSRNLKDFLSDCNKTSIYLYEKW